MFAVIKTGGKQYKVAKDDVIEAGAGLLASPVVRAQGWQPNGPIRIVVPFPAGGTTDLMQRTALRRVEPALGQTVLLDYKPGAAGIPAIQAALAHYGATQHHISNAEVELDGVIARLRALHPTLIDLSTARIERIRCFQRLLQPRAQ